MVETLGLHQPENNLPEPSAPKTSQRWRETAGVASIASISLLAAVAGFNLAEKAGICDRLFIAAVIGGLAAVAATETSNDLPNWVDGVKELFGR